MIILAGYILDMLIGDPQWRWHPVRIIGGLTRKLEKTLNGERFNKIFTGVILVIAVVGAAAFCVFGIVRLAGGIHPVLGFICSAAAVYSVLSIKSLGVEADKIYKALKDGSIEKARRGLSMIVGRDTDKLNETDIIRATVETVAESSMDGIIAPLFYAFLGGPVLAWGYKAVNTLDSMVGYRNQRYKHFGMASAKLDAAVNFIPAKITCLVFVIAGAILKKNRGSALQWALKYLGKGPEYNGESTEAVMAAALGVRLGGLNFYEGAPVEKQIIGDGIYALEARHIKESVRIAYLSSFLFMAMGMALVYLI